MFRVLIDFVFVIIIMFICTACIVVGNFHMLYIQCSCCLYLLPISQPRRIAKTQGKTRRKKESTPSSWAFATGMTVNLIMYNYWQPTSSRAKLCYVIEVLITHLFLWLVGLLALCIVHCACASGVGREHKNWVCTSHVYRTIYNVQGSGPGV